MDISISWDQFVRWAIGTILICSIQKPSLYRLCRAHTTKSSAVVHLWRDAMQCMSRSGGWWLAGCCLGHDQLKLYVSEMPGDQDIRVQHPCKQGELVVSAAYISPVNCSECILRLLSNWQVSTQQVHRFQISAVPRLNFRTYFTSREIMSCYIHVYASCSPCTVRPQLACVSSCALQ
jgi:hypothetical protein